MTRRSDPPDSLARRRFLALLLASPFAAVLGARNATAGSGPLAPSSSAWLAAAAAGKLPATPECADADDPTPALTAGPFFTPNSPERASLLEKNTKGKPIEIHGRVFGRDCKPVAGALLDFWQADSLGEYDNEGYKLRGHQFADAECRYKLTTVVPGLYPGRTRHIHVRVQPKDGKILTTQLYFPEEKRNARDGIYVPELLLTPEGDGPPRKASFHFVLDRG